MKDVFVGLDGGTGGMRAFAFDERGNTVCRAESRYDTRYPKNGWAEQRPQDWRRSAGDCLRAASRDCAAASRRIAAVCAATTSSTVGAFLKDGTPLCDAILWMDARASQEADEIDRLTGQRLSVNTFLVKILWLKRHRPDVYEKAEVLCEYQGYLMYLLTGKWCASVNTACNAGYDKRRGGYDEEFYRRIGLADAVAKLPQRAVCAGDVIGPVCDAAAREYGLAVGTPVVQGGIDASIGMLGMGVYGPGRVALMTGSSNLAMALTRTPLFSRGDEVNLGPDFLIDGYYSSVTAQASSGSVLKWFEREFCKDLEKDALAQLDRLAADVPPGADGITVLDYWQGNRVPHDDADVRGLIYGLSMSASREQIYRAVLEGVACGTDDLIDAFRRGGYAVDAVSISGGTARSKLFLQIHADVSGVRFDVASDHSAALGAGICAAKGVGAYGTLGDACAAMASCENSVYPDGERHEAYKAVLKKYRALYPAIRDWSRI